MASTSNQDEMFGLPFLFTGGLPNSLEKFSEGNLRCFLIYLIEVVGKANRQNVWLKPAWWKSKLIPYSPISVDTSKVPQEQVVKELRSLVENCYKYYKAEKILEVSRQLSAIPRILLGIRDNKNNTMTVYDTNSKAVYVTIRPENLYYDEKSLDKVSKDWRDSYNQEDVTFCEIKKSTKDEKKMNTKNADDFTNTDCVIEVLDSDDEDKTIELSPKRQIRTPHSYPRPISRPNKKLSRGTVLKVGDKMVIALSDSDDDDVKTKSPQPNTGKRKKKKEDDIEFICEYSFSKPCPKRFKQQAKTISPSVIVLSDSDGESEDTIYISSYTSLAKDHTNMKFFPESPNKNMQKSILGPLICSPRKVDQNISQLLSPQKSKPRPESNDLKKPDSPLPALKKSTTVSTPAISNQKPCSDTEEDFLRPTKEELFLRKKKKNRTFYPPLPTSVKETTEPVDLKLPSHEEFMRFLKMDCKEDEKDDTRSVSAEHKLPPQMSEIILPILRSNRHSIFKMPLDWIQELSANNRIVLSKRSTWLRHIDPTEIKYESYCSTDPLFIDYSIKAAKSSIQKDWRIDYRQSSRKGFDKSSWSIEKWSYQEQESSQRRKRASVRRVRSLMTNDHSLSPVQTLSIGTLAPTIQRLPVSLFVKSLQMTVKLKEPV